MRLLSFLYVEVRDRYIYNNGQREYKKVRGIDMNLQGLLLEQTIIMFLLIGIGYILTKTKMLSATSGKELSVLLLYVAFPSVVIDAFISAGKEGMGEVGVSFILAGVGLLVAMIIAYLSYGKKNGIENFGACFGNAGFMGLPLVLAVFGQQGVLHVTGVVVLLNLGQWTYGVMLMTGNTEAIKLKKLVKNPILVATVIGLVLVYMPFELPAVITQPIGFAKNMNTPLAMVIVGISLAQTNLINCLKDKSMYIMAGVRLILIPMATMLVYKVLPFGTREMLLALMVVLSTPVGSNVAIAADMYNKDSQKAVQYVCFSTILSIISIPMVMGIVERFI